MHCRCWGWWWMFLWLRIRFRSDQWWFFFEFSFFENARILVLHVAWLDGINAPHFDAFCFATGVHQIHIFRGRSYDYGPSISFLSDHHLLSKLELVAWIALVFFVGNALFNPFLVIVVAMVLLVRRTVERKVETVLRFFYLWRDANYRTRANHIQVAVCTYWFHNGRNSRWRANRIGWKQSIWLQRGRVSPKWLVRC